MCSKELYAEETTKSLLGGRVSSAEHLQSKHVCNPPYSGAGAGSLHPGRRTPKW